MDGFFLQHMPLIFEFEVTFGLRTKEVTILVVEPLIRFSLGGVCITAFGKIFKD